MAWLPWGRSNNMTTTKAPSSEVSGTAKAQDVPLRPKVLLVDDQPARLLTYEAILEGTGVTCTRALSGTEALERLLKDTYAVILLDVSMPDMDGFETARRIREHPRFERTPIIFVTGVHITELDKLRGYEVGAIDYIPVPVVPEILRSKVTLLVELYTRRTELQALNRELEAAHARLEAERNEAVSNTSLDNREWLSSVLNSMNEEVYLTDVQRRYVYTNAAGLRAFGHTPVEGMEVERWAEGLEIYRADGTLRPAIEAPPLRALSGEIVRDEEHIVRMPGNGELRHRQVSSAPVRNSSGHIIGSVSVVRDVTERKRIEEEARKRDIRAAALLRLSDRFRLLEEPADLAYAAAEILGETLRVSRCGYGTVDRQAETITIERDWNAPGSDTIAGQLHFREYGTYIDELKRGQTVVCVNVKDDPRTAASAEALKAIQVGSFVNMPVIEKEGTVALLYLTHTSARDWPEEELSFVREVAERTRIAVERRRSEQAVAAELIERLEAERALREANRRKDDFIAMLSHELRNPLVPICTGIGLLKGAADPDGMLARIQPVMERQMAHVVKLIDDLLDVSRITSGRIELHRKPVLLRDVVETAVEAHRETIAANGIELIMALDQPGRLVNVDSTRFVQVISNLLSNATKFTPADGRIVVTTTTAEPGQGTADLVLKVADTGMGISPERLPRIFDLFGAASSDPKELGSRRGMGVGLAFARQIVEMHGGTLEARSEGLGRGAEFTLRAPVAAVSDSTSVGQDSRKRVAGTRVLVVDDNRDSAELMVLLLESMGTEARASYDGLSALAMAEEVTPRIVLLDIGLPDIDGYEVCRQLRTRFGRTLRIVALTGWGQERDKQEAARVGFDEHLTKPAYPEDLRTLIAKLLED